MAICSSLPEGTEVRVVSGQAHVVQWQNLHLPDIRLRLTQQHSQRTTRSHFVGPDHFGPHRCNLGQNCNTIHCCNPCMHEASAGHKCAVAAHHELRAISQACLNVLAIPFAVSEILSNPVVEPEFSDARWRAVLLPGPSW